MSLARIDVLHGLICLETLQNPPRLLRRKKRLLHLLVVRVANAAPAEDLHRVSPRHKRWQLLSLHLIKTFARATTDLDVVAVITWLVESTREVNLCCANAVPQVANAAIKFRTRIVITA